MDLRPIERSRRSFMDTYATMRATAMAKAFFEEPIPLDHDYFGESEEFVTFGTKEGECSFTEMMDSWIEFFYHFDRYARPYPFSSVDLGLWSVSSEVRDLLGFLVRDPVRACALFSAMPRMFSDYLIEARDVPETGFHMWWDLLEWEAKRLEQAEFEANGTTTIRDAHLAALEVILAIDDDHCQYCALHGLGHLEHPRRPEVVTAFIERERTAGKLHEWSLEWLEECRDGTVM